MEQVLYRKYRSKDLSEIIGQDHITQTLEKAIKQGRISHAYLFTGPRGVGKTSIARILAHRLNGLDYNIDEMPIDIIEIDAASNRGIDEIRDLREKVYIAPVQAKYKVYIIDEVHMLTTPAFNALLKTLEEPPEHVVFILATTDAHKLPETIISRTQRFSFKPVTTEKVIAHLKEIAKKEKIDISTEALRLLAEHGEGSFRDSIGLLDQARSQGQKLSESDVSELLGVPSHQAVESLLSALELGQSSELSQTLQGLYDRGYQAATIAKQLGQLLRRQLLESSLNLSRASTLKLLDRLLDVASSYSPDRLLEIVLLETLEETSTTVNRPVDQPTAKTPPKPTEKPVEAVAVKPAEIELEAPAVDSIVEQSESKSAVENSEPVAAVTTNDSLDNRDTQATKLDDKLWAEIVQKVKQKHNTLYGVIRMAEPEITENGDLTLVFAFAFHQKQFNNASNQKTISAIIQDSIGDQIKISCRLDTSRQVPTEADSPIVLEHQIAPDNSSQAEEPQESLQPEQVTAISNIFGGGELLES